MQGNVILRPCNYLGANYYSVDPVLVFFIYGRNILGGDKSSVALCKPTFWRCPNDLYPSNFQPIFFQDDWKGLPWTNGNVFYFLNDTVIKHGLLHSNLKVVQAV